MHGCIIYAVSWYWHLPLTLAAMFSQILCFLPIADNKQLLDEVERDIMTYQNRGLCYLPKEKAEADNTDTRF